MTQTVHSGEHSRSEPSSLITTTLGACAARSAKSATSCSLCSRYVFDLPEGTDSGLSVASALLTQAATEGACVDDKGKPVIRPYTPVTAPDQKDRLDLLIKIYDQGKMSKHFETLKPGDSLKLKGPIPKCASWRAGDRVVPC
jgi:NADPH-dependent ferric siderophore reductase